MKASMVDLRKRMSAVVEALRRNEPVTLTYRGKVIGTIHPTGKKSAAGEQRKDIRDHPAFGMWADREDMKNPTEWVRQKRARRKQRLRAIWEQPMPGEQAADK